MPLIRPGDVYFHALFKQARAAELPEMLEEHKAIVGKLRVLEELARKEDNLECVRFADELRLHAQNEEEVLHPASMLVGEYLKLKMGN